MARTVENEEKRSQECSHLYDCPSGTICNTDCLPQYGPYIGCCEPSPGPACNPSTRCPAGQECHVKNNNDGTGYCDDIPTYCTFKEQCAPGQWCQGFPTQMYGICCPGNWECPARRELPDN